MNIDITKIVNDKIDTLEKSGTIKQKIEEGIEKTILSAITSALEDYELKNSIKKQISSCVSNVATEIGFSGYNSFIAEKIKEITDGVMREDIQNKIQQTFADLLVQKYEGVKLSDIFNKYREWVRESTEEADQYDRREFVCNLEEKRDGSFTHYYVTFNDEAIDKYDKPQIKFSFCNYQNEQSCKIAWLILDGTNMGGQIKLGYLSEIQLFLANLYYNETKIILDIDDIDDDNSFDIDD